MAILSRYITKTVLISILLVSFVILSLQSIIQLIGQLEGIREAYQLPQVALYTLLRIPDTFYEIIPLSCFIGCLVGLGDMASKNELVIIRASGVSLWKICYLVLKPAFAIILLVMLVGEFLVPLSAQKAESMRNTARSPGGKYIDQGKWHREGNEYIFMNSIETNGVLHGVSRFIFDENKMLIKASYAKKAERYNNGWVLYDIINTTYNNEASKVTKKQKEFWDIRLSEEFLKILISKPEHLSILGLYTYINYLESHELEAGEYKLAFWKKTLIALSIFSLITIGLSFIFGPLRSVSFGLRLFTGVTIGIIFLIFQNLLGAFSLVFGIAPIFAVFLPIGICFGIGWVMLKLAA